METPKIIACMSLPRIGWNDSWGCIHSALVPWGIPIVEHNSVFWAEGLSRTFTMAMEAGAEWILTIDYDSLFGPQHVARLIDAMKSEDFDAIATLQARREHHTPLGCVQKENANGRFLKAESAHFGLTMLRVESLKRTEHPWLLSVPNKRGEWGDGRVDADLWFWNRWRAAGNTVAIDVQNRIGHLEVVCVDFIDRPDGEDIAFEPRIMSPHKYRKMLNEQAVTA